MTYAYKENKFDTAVEIVLLAIPAILSIIGFMAYAMQDTPASPAVAAIFFFVSVVIGCMVGCKVIKFFTL